MTFCMPNGRLRSPVSRVALASCEFPMVQWTVEEEWCRLYTLSGIALANGECDIIIECGDAVAQVRLPMHHNPATATTRGPHLVVTCAHPHGLAACDGTPNTTVFGAADARSAVLLGGADGDIPLRDVTLVSDVEFWVRTSASGTGVHTLHLPRIPSPDALCRMLTAAARGGTSSDVGQITFRYDARCDQVILAVTCNASTTSRTACVRATTLARRLGLSTVRVPTTPPTTTLPSETTRLWESTRLTPGFYAPCHRPMSTGAPLRLTSELELSLNRLYFPIIKSGDAPHQLIFAAPDGHVHAACVPPGRYAPTSLAALLQREMNRAVGDESAYVFTVRHGNARVFCLSCKRRTDNVGTPFGLLFHHPLCMQAERLGFPAQPLTGSDTYRASTIVDMPHRPGGIVRASEITHQKRLRFHVASPPSMVAEVVDAPRTGVVRLRTHVNRMRYAHGLRPGDVIHVASSNATVVLADDGSERPLAASTAAHIPSLCRCVVVDDASVGIDDVDLVCVRVPPVRGVGDVLTALVVTPVTDPWNLATCHAGSVPAALLGVRPGVTQWGIDGSVHDDADRALPPFDAPHVHDLDHPDYVLITFSEGTGTSLEHAYNSENRGVFCKLSLYPLFREERMLPRDTALLGSKLTTFTIGFWNPDMRQSYHFHGAEFSFSLNFVIARH